MLDHLLLDLKQYEAVAPHSLSLFVVLSAAQLSAPSLSHWFMPIQLVMAYHNWSLSLALSTHCRQHCGSHLTRLCEQGPLCVVDTAQFERAAL